MQKSKLLSCKRLFALALCCCLVCGCLPLSFSANAATVTQTDAASVQAYAAGGKIYSSDHCRGQFFEVEAGTISITVEGNYGGATPVRDVVAFVNQPAVGSSGGYQIASFPDAFGNPLVLTLPEGYHWIYVCVCYNATSSTALTITVDNESIIYPDIPSYDGTTGGSGSVVTGIQQGKHFDNVYLDTVTSQLTAQLMQETVLPIDDDEDGVTDKYLLKSVYRVPVLVSCTITNRNPKYAWLDQATIGYNPIFFQSIGILAGAATSYELCDIFYTSEGFADAISADGTAHFRFNDDNYYLGTVIIKPYGSLSASALLFYDITIVTEAPTADDAQLYLERMANIMRTSVMNNVQLSGIAGVNSFLEKIPTGATTSGQDEIRDSVNTMSTNVTNSINSLKDQQAQQFVQFMAPADSNSLGNTFAGFEEQIAGIGFYALTQDIIRRVDDLIKSDPPPAELTFPAFGLDISGVYHQLWEPYTFSFTDWGENFPALVSAVRFATLGVLCFWLVRYCNKLVHKIWGAA